MGASTVIANACENLQSQITSGANSIAQRAVIQALSGDHPSIKIMLEAFRQRRDLVLSLLKEIPNVITNIPEEFIQQIENWINNLLRPMFGYKSSLEMAKNVS